jgi:signal peptidase I
LNGSAIATSAMTISNMSRRNAILNEIREWIFTFAGAFLIVMLLNTKVFATTQVRQTSMMDTLIEGQHLFVEKLSYDFRNPLNGEIIVFIENTNPHNYLDELRIFFTDVFEVFKPIEAKSNIRLVKRVIGIPGDLVDIKDGKVFVNNKVLTEPYTKGETLERDMKFPAKVPAGKYIVMGDNREVSKDSRTFGFIDRSQIEGRAVFRFWPMDKVGGLK